MFLHNSNKRQVGSLIRYFGLPDLPWSFPRNAGCCCGSDLRDSASGPWGYTHLCCTVYTLFFCFFLLLLLLLSSGLFFSTLVRSLIHTLPPILGAPRFLVRVSQLDRTYSHSSSRIRSQSSLLTAFIWPWSLEGPLRVSWAAALGLWTCTT